MRLPACERSAAERMFSTRRRFFGLFSPILHRDRSEQFYSYLQHMVTVIHLSTTGVTTLQVRVFRAADALHRRCFA